MNQTQALTRARKILGPKASIRVYNSVPVGDERAQQIARRKALTERLKSLQEARDARRAEILKADAEYQKLRAEAAAVEKERDSLHAGYHHRVEVIVSSGISYSVKGAGDNFDEAIAALVSQ